MKKNVDSARSFKSVLTRFESEPSLRGSKVFYTVQYIYAIQYKRVIFKKQNGKT